MYVAWRWFVAESAASSTILAAAATRYEGDSTLYKTSLLNYSLFCRKIILVRVKLELRDINETIVFCLCSSTLAAGRKHGRLSAGATKLIVCHRI
jgi:hypothetical protein